MNKASLIFKHELTRVLDAWDYRITVLLPLLIGLAMWLGPLFLQKGSPSSGQPTTPLTSDLDLYKAARSVFEIPQVSLPQGYVDEVGLVTQYPPDFDHRQLRKYESDSEARQAMQSGQISSYYVIPEQYLSLGLVYKFVPARDSTWMGLPDRNLDMLLSYNLANADDARLAVVEKPILALKETNLSPEGERSLFDPDDPSKGQAYITPYFGAFFLWFIIAMPSMLLMTGLNRESENRVMEVLLSSARTDEIVLGKFTGLGLAGLIMLVATLTGVGLYVLPVGRFVIPGMQRLTPETLAWVAAFALAGYLLYGLIITTLGMLLPNSPDASALSSIAMAPCIIPVFLFQLILDRPHDLAAVALSLFPLTAPTTLLMRLMSSPVPTWQLIVALVLLLASTVGMVKVAAVLLRTKSLLTGFSIRLWMNGKWGRLIHP